MTNPLFRVYLSNDEGDCTTTLALVWAETDTAAIEQVKHLCGEEQVASWATEQGLDREDAFVTAECIEDRERLENAIEDIPGIVAGGPVAVAALIEAFAGVAGFPGPDPDCEVCKGSGWHSYWHSTLEDTIDAPCHKCRRD